MKKQATSPNELYHIYITHSLYKTMNPVRMKAILKEIRPFVEAQKKEKIDNVLFLIQNNNQ